MIIVVRLILIANAALQIGIVGDHNEVWGKVIFSQACVIPSVHRGGVRIQRLGRWGLHPLEAASRGLGRPPPASNTTG